MARTCQVTVAKTAPLTMPRYPLLGLPEFGTISALANVRCLAILLNCEPTRIDTSGN